ncbi:hypothetical protein A2U01_0108571, partial [Trifolium medium]|nr:hypothetical protein [Trifolium medium]
MLGDLSAGTHFSTLKNEPSASSDVAQRQLQNTRMTKRMSGTDMNDAHP